MYKPKLDKDIRCPLEYGFDIFRGKWKSRIICVLAAKKTLRYSTLRKEMTNITDADFSGTAERVDCSRNIARHNIMKYHREWNTL